MGAACDLTALVDRHFGVRISPDEERRLRAHLPDCAACRERYTRQALLSRLDPRAATAATRLARGLGVGLPRPARPLLPALALVATAACLALLGVRLNAPPTEAQDSGFTARSGGPVPASPRLQVYALTQGAARPAGESVGAAQELAFAYRNPDAKRFLMVFARDAAGRVYWYHPSWTSPDEDPAAIPISPGAALHELPEAISQPLAPGRLSLHAVFLDAPLTVRQLEARLEGASDVGAALPPGAVHEVRVLQVER